MAQSASLQPVDFSHKNASEVQIASSLILLVTAVALVVIIAENPAALQNLTHLSTSSSAFPFVVTCGALGGVSLVTLTVSTIVLCQLRNRPEREVGEEGEAGGAQAEDDLELEPQEVEAPHTPPQRPQQSPSALSLSPLPLDAGALSPDVPAELQLARVQQPQPQPQQAAAQPQQQPQLHIQPQPQQQQAAPVVRLSTRNLKELVITPLFASARGLLEEMIVSWYAAYKQIPDREAVRKKVATEIKQLNEAFASLEVLFGEFLSDHKKALQVFVSYLIGPFDLHFHEVRLHVAKCYGNPEHASQLDRDYQLMLDAHQLVHLRKQLVQNSIYNAQSGNVECNPNQLPGVFFKALAHYKDLLPPAFLKAIAGDGAAQQAVADIFFAKLEETFRTLHDADKTVVSKKIIEMTRLAHLNQDIRGLLNEVLSNLIYTMRDAKFAEQILDQFLGEFVTDKVGILVRLFARSMQHFNLLFAHDAPPVTLLDHLDALIPASAKDDHLMVSREQRAEFEKFIHHIFNGTPYGVVHIRETKYTVRAATFAVTDQNRDLFERLPKVEPKIGAHALRNERAPVLEAVKHILADRPVIIAQSPQSYTILAIFAEHPLRTGISQMHQTLVRFIRGIGLERINFGEGWFIGKTAKEEVVSNFEDTLKKVLQNLMLSFDAQVHADRQKRLFSALHLFLEAFAGVVAYGLVDEGRFRKEFEPRIVASGEKFSYDLLLAMQHNPDVSAIVKLLTQQTELLKDLFKHPETFKQFDQQRQQQKALLQQQRSPPPVGAAAVGAAAAPVEKKEDKKGH